METNYLQKLSCKSKFVRKSQKILGPQIAHMESPLGIAHFKTTEENVGERFRRFFHC
jgi:hypothetical protein